MQNLLNAKKKHNRKSQMTRNTSSSSLSALYENPSSVADNCLERSYKRNAEMITEKLSVKVTSINNQWRRGKRVEIDSEQDRLNKMLKKNNSAQKDIIRQRERLIKMCDKIQKQRRDLDDRKKKIACTQDKSGTLTKKIGDIKKDVQEMSCIFDRHAEEYENELFGISKRQEFVKELENRLNSLKASIQEKVRVKEYLRHAIPSKIKGNKMLRSQIEEKEAYLKSKFSEVTSFVTVAFHKNRSLDDQLRTSEGNTYDMEARIRAIRDLHNYQ